MMIKCIENQTNVKRSYKAKTSKQEKKEDIWKYMRLCFFLLNSKNILISVPFSSIIYY